MKQAAEAATQNGGVNMKVTGDADSCENLPHHFGYVVITIPTRVVATAAEARRSHRGIMLRIRKLAFPSWTGADGGRREGFLCSTTKARRCPGRSGINGRQQGESPWIAISGFIETSSREF